ncbi:MAG: ornithine carbamoyltransferase [Kiritimatiellia bacterium]
MSEDQAQHYPGHSVKMKGKSLLTLSDLSDRELVHLIDLAGELKRRKNGEVRGSLLAGRNLALLFEKASTRTRCAAAVAIAEEGGNSEYLAPDQIHLGHKESVADTARVLGRMFDAILFRGFSQKTAETLAECAGVPVYNGLTDAAHPTQALADMLTIYETFGSFKDLKLVYCGDGGNNVARSLTTACAMLGLDFVNCTPEELAPPRSFTSAARKLASKHGGKVSVIGKPETAAKGANVIYTDVWASMGEESKLAERIKLLTPYRVDMKLMQKTGNLNSNKVIFLHCLPAFHDNNTELTGDTGAMEVTDEVFQSEFSRVFDQAENRVHTLKALMAATL